MIYEQSNNRIFSSLFMVIVRAEQGVYIWERFRPYWYSENLYSRLLRKIEGFGKWRNTRVCPSISNQWIHIFVFASLSQGISWFPTRQHLLLCLRLQFSMFENSTQQFFRNSWHQHSLASFSVWNVLQRIFSARFRASICLCATFWIFYTKTLIFRNI
jgi:hypothetical protein